MSLLSLGLTAVRPPSRQSRLRMRCCAELDGIADYKAGARIRVAKSVMVYHIPKLKEGVDIKGMEGAVVSNVRFYMDQELSPNYPWKVQFEKDTGGKRPSKFFVHFTEDEIELVV